MKKIINWISSLFGNGGQGSHEAPGVNEMIVEDLHQGEGDGVDYGQRISVHYTGWLYHADKPEHKGKEFDSSVRRDEPFVFVPGLGQVIAGWENGVLGMQVGGKRRLTIPPQLAYGDSGAGRVIPPNATLVFDIELLSLDVV